MLSKEKRRIYLKYWYLKNKERIRLQRKEHYLNNKEKLAVSGKIYRLKNKEKRKLYTKKYRLKNREKARLVSKEWYLNNKEKLEFKLRKNKYLNEYYSNKYKNDEAFALKERLRKAFLRAFTCYSKTGKIWKSKKYGIDYSKIIEYLGSCPGNRVEYHIDHIKPLSLFDFNDPKQVRQAFAPMNHQWLTVKENLQKSNKIT